MAGPIPKTLCNIDILDFPIVEVMLGSDGMLFNTCLFSLLRSPQVGKIYVAFPDRSQHKTFLFALPERLNVITEEFSREIPIRKAIGGLSNYFPATSVYDYGTTNIYMFYTCICVSFYLTRGIVLYPCDLCCCNAQQGGYTVDL